MGGSYFIGRSITEAFRKEDVDLYILNRGTSPLNYSNVTEIHCDRENSQAMKEALKEYSFHTIIDVSGTNKKHLEILLSAINKNELKKFIFISSSAVYDVEHLQIPYKETDSLAPNKYWQDYGTNKIEAEFYLKSALEKVDLFILRPPYIYGEYNYAQRESFIFEHIINNRPILIPNFGETKLQFIYCHDLANICVDLYHRNLTGVHIYNTGNPQGISVKEWILTISKVLNKEAIIKEFHYADTKFKVRDFFPFHDYDNVLDIHLSFKQTPFEEGLLNAYQWYLKTNIVFKSNIIENEKRILKKYFNI